jgi:hypothetical protein
VSSEEVALHDHVPTLSADGVVLWTDEIGFSNWLHGNIDALAVVIGVPLVSRRREAPVGRLSADILAETRDHAEAVIIENQVYAANHGHFGQILTYAAHYDARVIVWIASAFRSEYRAAIAWLNSFSHKHFYAVELRGDGLSIPELVVVAGPESAFESSDQPSPLVSPVSSHARATYQSGAYIRAPFEVVAERTASPGQLVLNAIFERMAELLVGSPTFPRLRKPAGDRNHYIIAAGPVKDSHWAVVFEDVQVGIALVFEDRATAKDHIQRLATFAADIDSSLGYIVDFRVGEGRKKQKAILYRPFTYEQRSQEGEDVALWSVQTITAFAKIVERLRIF